MVNNRISKTGLYLYGQFQSNVWSMNSHHGKRTVNVGGVGSVVSAAYEQLRNAAEYTQEHLLRQRAVRRFYSRNLSLGTKKDIDRNIGEELIIELTQAGYIENNSIFYDVIDSLHKKAVDLYQTYWRLIDNGIDKPKAEEWILDILSVDTEAVIDEDRKKEIFLQFSYKHYMETLDRQLFINSEQDSSQYEASLYVAVHRSLLKSDIATVRADMLRLYGIQTSNFNTFLAFNRSVDGLFSSPLTDQLSKYISKYGAPLRVLRAMVEDNPSAVRILGDKREFLDLYKSQIEHEYNKSNSRLNTGLVKSIAFLLLTKTLIGLFIEIPYDLAVTGTIVLLPLIINLFFPAVYLLILRLGLKTPSIANTKALVDYIESTFYEDTEQVVLSPQIKPQQYPMSYSILYGVMFLVAFSVVITLLIGLNFNILQGAIFLVFLASASFLGFRLSRIIRELELVTEKPGIISIIRDFFYFPFIVLGQKISEKYANINFVSLTLDTVIELPLKTVLRLLRQWSGFLNDQKDRL